MELQIEHDKEQHKFYAIVDGKESVLHYSTPSKTTLDYYSTFVPNELRGQKIAEQIVIFALEYAKKNNYKVIPSCPYVKKLLERHKEYQNLISDT